MADFSRAEYSKNHKGSFDAAIQATRDYLVNLENEYNKYWNELEALRKERAALIENAIKVLKDNNIKLGKQLCRCNNEELNIELKRALPHLGFSDLEEIQVGIVKINMRFDKITEISAHLVRISNELAKFRTPEKDKDDEVVINFQLAKKSRQDQIREKVVPKASEEKTREEGLEEVVEHHKAGDAAVTSLNKYLDENRKKMEPTSEETQILSSIIEENDLQATTDTKKKESDLTSEVDDITSILEDREKELDIDEEEAVVLSEERPTEEFVEFTIEKDVTLVDIANGVYGPEASWRALYEYSTNRGKIDRVAAQHKLDVEKVCTEPGYLNGIELIFPLELVTYEPINDKKEVPKAA